MTALLDVNALVALVWDSHVHHATIRSWFSTNSARGWATSPLTESGFVRVSANARILPHAVSVEAARQVLRVLREQATHQFLTDDVSIIDQDVPPLIGYRQVTDAHLLTVARRHGARVVTFDVGLAQLAAGDDAELLSAL